VADRGPPRIGLGLGLVGDVAAVAGAVDFHGSGSLPRFIAVKSSSINLVLSGRAVFGRMPLRIRGERWTIAPKFRQIGAA
jgi:hypothetical protein